MTNKSFPDYRLLIPFALIALLLLYPILGHIWYPVHDTTHIARLYLMEKTIRGGQFPPIWASELNSGLGYPLFHFYSPLFYYLSLFVKMLTGSYFTAIKIVLFTALLSGMMGIYQLVKNWVGRAGAIVSAVSFGTLPYIALNLYVRGAYAELLSISLLPWLFYVWQKLDTKKQVVWSSIITTLFILSHNLIPLITLPFLAIWIIYHHPHSLKKIILPTVLTLLLSSFYLLPLLLERSFVQADNIAKTTDYSLHFVYPSQLWNSTWGFGGSGPGIEDGLSFKIGKIQLLLALFSSALLLFKKRSGRVIYLLCSTLAAAFMTTSYSQIIWQKIPLLGIVQFPWRYLSILGFFVSVLAGLFFARIRFSLMRKIVAAIVVTGLLFVNLKLFKPQSTISPDVNAYTTKEYLNTIPFTVKEFKPKWTSASQDFTINSDSKSYYPTWEVFVDNIKVKTYPDKNGLLSFDNPSGSTNIRYNQSHTTLERISYSLTILGMILIIVYAKI